MNETIGLVITASVVFTVLIVLGWGSYLMVRDAEIRFQERKKEREKRKKDNNE